MEGLFWAIAGMVISLLVEWAFAQLNPKAAVNFVAKMLRKVIKDKNALNKIENETGRFLIEFGAETILASPDDAMVESLAQSAKDIAEELKDAMRK